MPAGILYPLLAACLAVGLHLQRGPRGERLRRVLWQANYVVVLPAAAVYAFCSIELDAALLRLVGCALLGWWGTVALAGAWSRIATRDREMRGALWLVGAFPNTGFIGFPLAQLAFGLDGLRLAVIYDQVSLVVPAIVVATIIARGHAGSSDAASGAPGPWATVLRSPPLWTVLVVVLLRLTVLTEPVELDALGMVVGVVVGPLGFLLLGLSVPLGGFRHPPRELVAVGGAILVRVVAAPLLLAAGSVLLGAAVPPAMYLIAAMPTAFHALIIARLHGVAPELVRLGVIASTMLVVGAVITMQLLGVLPG